MDGRTFSLSVSRNPFLQILSLIVLGALLIGAVALGAVILTAVLLVAVVAAIAISVRVWWFKRKLRRSPEAMGGLPPAAGRLIEADYVVVREPADDSRAGESRPGRDGSERRPGRDGRERRPGHDDGESRQSRGGRTE